MRSIDLTPLYRTSIGFDRVANMLDALGRSEAGGGYPPYNIEKTGETDYRITLAVAGFAQDDISIESKDGELVIAGGRQEKSEPERAYLYRGIAERSFERRFKLADHVRAVGARLENGLLNVELVRKVPEALKPRKIEIETASRADRIAAE